MNTLGLRAVITSIGPVSASIVATQSVSVNDATTAEITATQSVNINTSTSANAVNTTTTETC